MNTVDIAIIESVISVVNSMNLNIETRYTKDSEVEDHVVNVSFNKTGKPLELSRGDLPSYGLGIDIPSLDPKSRAAKDIRRRIKKVVDSPTFKDALLADSQFHIRNLIVSEVISKLRPSAIPQQLKVNISQAKVTKILHIQRDTLSKTTGKIRNQLGQFYSLASLQMLLNQSLHNKIKQNMGDGNSTVVLNYRTGRLANSVKVDKITISKNDMLTAFYSYMKYPYATFSGPSAEFPSGGRQQMPRSRDPKLLISRSIREVAQLLVTNRLRAVSA